MSRLERAARAVAAALVFVALAEFLFALDPVTASAPPLWLYGAVATPLIAVAFAAPSLDLRSCIVNGLAEMAALPLYAELTCDCAANRFGSPLSLGAAFFAHVFFVSLPGLVTLTLVVWWIAWRVKHGVLWEPKQW